MTPCAGPFATSAQPLSKNAAAVAHFVSALIGFTPLLNYVAKRYLIDRRNRFCILAVNCIHAALQNRLQIGWRRKAIVRPGEFGRRGGAHEVSGDRNNQLSLVVLKVTAAKERSQHGQILHARESIEILLRLLLNQSTDGQ